MERRTRDFHPARTLLLVKILDVFQANRLNLFKRQRYHFEHAHWHASRLEKRHRWNPCHLS
jgi:hypothetical protein